jgi:hypothetical protein
MSRVRRSRHRVGVGRRSRRRGLARLRFALPASTPGEDVMTIRAARPIARSARPMNRPRRALAIAVVLATAAGFAGSSAADSISSFRPVCETPNSLIVSVGLDASTGLHRVMGNTGQDYEVGRVAHAVPAFTPAPLTALLALSGSGRGSGGGPGREPARRRFGRRSRRERSRPQSDPRPAGPR